MNATQHERTLLTQAGFSYEYPGFWLKDDVTISDGVSVNGLPWEVQAEQASESFPTVDAALAFAIRALA